MSPGLFMRRRRVWLIGCHGARPHPLARQRAALDRNRRAGDRAGVLVASIGQELRHGWPPAACAVMSGSRMEARAGHCSGKSGDSSASGYGIYGRRSIMRTVERSDERHGGSC